MSTTWPGPHLIYATANGTQIYVSKGGKSLFNFKVQYQEPGKRLRTPKHIHLIIDLYMKKVGNKCLTMQLVDHLIQDVILRVQPSTTNPPILQVFSPDHIRQFQALDAYGEYSVEFLLVVGELIIIQEKTNYPHGTMTLNLFRSFREERDIFTVVSTASFRGER
ncbi:MAG: hypothetical protein H5T61_04195 [Thermoflexales bacterium]|nr:hypothetical protein [Thermoflexales bacterium]